MIVIPPTIIAIAITRNIIVRFSNWFSSNVPEDIRLKMTAYTNTNTGWAPAIAETNDTGPLAMDQNSRIEATGAIISLNVRRGIVDRGRCKLTSCWSTIGRRETARKQPPNASDPIAYIFKAAHISLETNETSLVTRIKSSSAYLLVRLAMARQKAATKGNARSHLNLFPELCDLRLLEMRMAPDTVMKIANHSSTASVSSSSGTAMIATSTGCMFTTGITRETSSVRMTYRNNNIPTARIIPEPTATRTGVFPISLGKGKITKTSTPKTIAIIATGKRNALRLGSRLVIKWLSITLTAASIAAASTAESAQLKFHFLISPNSPEV